LSNTTSANCHFVAWPPIWIGPSGRWTRLDSIVG
ncbi:MAG: hypothetical protein ACKVG1_06570, partial [Rhodospirillales bacterium]